ncbi:unnamed protein product [Trichobilharzia regenti]|nr:unnamed protein product [Trichobilharzia regenti]
MITAINPHSTSQFVISTKDAVHLVDRVSVNIQSVDMPEICLPVSLKAETDDEILCTFSTIDLLGCYSVNIALDDKNVLSDHRPLTFTVVTSNTESSVECADGSNLHLCNGDDELCKSQNETDQTDTHENQSVDEILSTDCQLKNGICLPHNGSIEHRNDEENSCTTEANCNVYESADGSDVVNDTTDMEANNNTIHQINNGNGFKNSEDSVQSTAATKIDMLKIFIRNGYTEKCEQEEEFLQTENNNISKISSHEKDDNGIVNGHSTDCTSPPAAQNELVPPAPLSVTIAGPSEAKIQCIDNGNGTCGVNYTPFAPGCYTINVVYNNELHIFGSPFFVQVYPADKPNLNVDDVLCYGVGVDSNEVHKASYVKFIVDASAIDPRGEGTVSAILTGPDNETSACQVVNSKDGKYVCNYTPLEEGK